MQVGPPRVAALGSACGHCYAHRLTDPALGSREERCGRQTARSDANRKVPPLAPKDGRKAPSALRFPP